MSKVYISVPETLLSDIDRTARELGMTRSGLLQEASAAFIATIEEQAAEKRRRERMRRASEWLKRVGVELGDFDAVSAVRDSRERRIRGTRGEPR